MSRAVQLLSDSVEHYGPAWLASMSRAVMGGIDLDPFSCALANEVIGAKQFYSAEDDGWAKPWFGRCYVNPPGGTYVLGKGRENRHNAQAYAFSKLALEYLKSEIREAIFVVFNLELFRHVQRYDTPHPLTFPTCFPSKRIDFLAPTEDGTVKAQGAPGHPNAIVYIGDDDTRFRSVFGPLGYVTEAS